MWRFLIGLILGYGWARTRGWSLLVSREMNQCEELRRKQKACPLCSRDPF